MNKQKWNQQKGGAKKPQGKLVIKIHSLGDISGYTKDKQDEWVSEQKDTIKSTLDHYIELKNKDMSTWSEEEQKNEKMGFYIFKVVDSLFGLDTVNINDEHLILIIKMFSILDEMSSQDQEKFENTVAQLIIADEKLRNKGIPVELLNELALLQVNIFINNTNCTEIIKNVTDAITTKIKLVNTIMQNKLSNSTPSVPVAAEGTTAPPSETTARKYYNHQVGQGINDIYYKEKYLKYKAKYTNLKRH